MAPAPQVNEGKAELPGPAGHGEGLQPGHEPRPVGPGHEPQPGALPERAEPGDEAEPGDGPGLQGGSAGWGGRGCCRRWWAKPRRRRRGAAVADGSRRSGLAAGKEKVRGGGGRAGGAVGPPGSVWRFSLPLASPTPFVGVFWSHVTYFPGRGGVGGVCESPGEGKVSWSGSGFHFGILPIMGPSFPTWRPRRGPARPGGGPEGGQRAGEAGG